jgi:2-iminobutanoate/2-iminopropanoate deaminase
MEEKMGRNIVASERLPNASPYFSHAVKAGGLVFVSGTAPYSPETGKLVGDTIEEQTAQALKNISAILEAAGSSLDRAVSATVILAEESDFAGMNSEWVRWFPVDPPARQGAKLPVKVPGLKVSIAMIAEA